MGIPSQRERVLTLLADIKDAARRPLFTEIGLFEALRTRRKLEDKTLTNRTPVVDVSGSLTRQADAGDLEASIVQKQTWEQLLFQASLVAPYMTEREYTEIIQLASILLLGFFLPHSTGYEWYLLQDASNACMQDFDPVEFVLSMPLENRLHTAIRRYAAGEYGEINTITDASLENSLDAFLSHGLAPFLSVRQVSRDKVELLHVLALAICPLCSSPKLPPATLQRLNRQNHPYWQRTKQLMQDFSTASQLRLSYGTRLNMIRLVLDNVNIPTPLNETSSDVVAPLLYGAVPHLRSALNDFAESWALSDSDADLARVTEAKLARCNERTSHEEWDLILQDLCEGRPCNCDGVAVDCHYARQEPLLSSLFRSSSCRSRTCAHASNSLADAIEWQLDLRTTKDEADPGDDGSEIQADVLELHTPPKCSPCLLVTLLSCAAEWFQTYPGTTRHDQTQNQSDDPFDTLIQASVQLVRNSDQRIAIAAKNLLLAALFRKDINLDTQQILLDSIMHVVSKYPLDCLCLKELIGITAKRSRPFAAALLDILHKYVANANAKASDTRFDAYVSIIAVISTNAPSAASLHVDKLVELVKRTEPAGATNAALLSLRQARYFSGAPTTADTISEQLLSDDAVDHWTKYRLCRHAIVSGNFRTAAFVLRGLCLRPLCEKHFIWLSTFEKLATAEFALSKNASKGIPEATVNLRAALTGFESLEQSFGERDESYKFQISFITLRLIFLDLITILRQLTWEIRLSGSANRKYTRMRLLQRNAVKGFLCLADRYRDLIRSYGRWFRTVQSTASLAVMERSCIILAKAGIAVFSDKRMAATLEVPETSTVPMAMLLHKVETAVDGLSSSNHGTGRAHLLLDVLEGILMVPAPVPLDLFVPLPNVSIEVALSADPDENDAGDITIIEQAPSLSFSFICSGQVPTRLLSGSACSILLWYTIRYIGPLEDEGLAEDGHELDNEDVDTVSHQAVVQRLPDLNPFLPVTGTILCGGSFCFPVLCPPLLDEGLFAIDVTVGCRDSAMDQWSMRTLPERPTIHVRVMRAP